MDRNNLLALAIQAWGEESQELMAIEECAELTKALCKISRGGSADDVIEEIADVQIMLEQMKIIFGEENVRHAEEKKLQRLEFRLNRWLGQPAEEK